MFVVQSAAVPLSVLLSLGLDLISTATTAVGQGTLLDPLRGQDPLRDEGIYAQRSHVPKSMPAPNSSRWAIEREIKTQGKLVRTDVLKYREHWCW